MMMQFIMCNVNVLLLDTLARCAISGNSLLDKDHIWDACYYVCATRMFFHPEAEELCVFGSYVTPAVLPAIR